MMRSPQLRRGVRVTGVTELLMILARLSQLVEMLAGMLTREVLNDLMTNEHTRSLRTIPKDELELRISALYLNLGRWIGDPSDDAVLKEYEDWGRTRFPSYLHAFRTLRSGLQPCSNPATLARVRCYDQPFGGIDYRFGKGWTGKVYWVYDGYHEHSSAVP
jgi:hypothetical protein